MLLKTIKMNYWLVKSEPEAYSWERFVNEGKAVWDGVRNYQARNNLREMRKGDLVLFYHSVSDKQVVGIARIVKETLP
jgi:predicted RNA-binding protein with PUA-like domain